MHVFIILVNISDLNIKYKMHGLTCRYWLIRSDFLNISEYRANVEIHIINFVIINGFELNRCMYFFFCCEPLVPSKDNFFFVRS